ncbi:unnamed protein product [Boreogadus saida]
MSVSAEESAVKVCVRVRPLIEREERATAEDSVPAPLYWKADRKSIHQLDDGVTTKSFSYDRVFSSSETTNHLYQDIAKPLVVSAVEGYNGTIFAYGQTSSGKTFTMMGSKLVPGVIPLSMEEVFQTIQNYPRRSFFCGSPYMEIYNETVTDLLVDNWKRKPLEVREALNKNIYVADLTEELVTCPAQALSWVFKGEKNRHYGKTKMNERSSRSHTIFRMILESREKSDPASGDNSEGAIIVVPSVDLAGSERASQTGAEGARFKEGCNINRSLFTLAQVIKKLSDESQRGFTNYRDSKLTRILQNSLGGNAKTVIICTITMAALEETLSTLQFASTAKKMKNDPHVTEVSDDGALLKRYRNEIVDLKRRLQRDALTLRPPSPGVLGDPCDGHGEGSLSQLLQEKDQLQKEQQDRIKEPHQAAGHRLQPHCPPRRCAPSLSLGLSRRPAIPTRRFTWGGKLVRLSGTTERDVGQSDLSFAEHFSRKRKADSSSMELLEATLLTPGTSGVADGADAPAASSSSAPVIRSRRSRVVAPFRHEDFDYGQSVTSHCFITSSHQIQRDYLHIAPTGTQHALILLMWGPAGQGAPAAPCGCHTHERSPLRSARLRTLNASTFNEQPSALRVRLLLEQQPDTGRSARIRSRRLTPVPHRFTLSRQPHSGRRISTLKQELQRKDTGCYYFI